MNGGLNSKLKKRRKEKDNQRKEDRELKQIRYQKILKKKKEN